MAFAVIDFETTGISPERGDRVTEVGLVLTDDFGAIEYEWSTLVNPRRDVGASHIHGLTARDLLDAPTFDEIADDILELVAGRSITAHNAVFDMRFLLSELSRAGYPIQERPAALCTMKWSGRLVGPAKLSQCCQALGIDLSNAHAALADAKATANLLPHFLAMSDAEGDWETDVRRASANSWPALNGKSGTAVLRNRSEPQIQSDGWLDEVLGATWIPGVPEDEASYLLVLDRALLDREISLTEGRELAAAARAASLSGQTIARLHSDYLRAVAVEALADGVVSSDEQAQLSAVADALRLPEHEIDTALEWAQANASSAKATKAFNLLPGDRVVFTGQMQRDRDEWVTTIMSAGLVSGGVAKSTKLLVAADPDSLSGKAAKARSYGIPVVSEEAFVRLFGSYCESN
ncbi:MAG TPA: exonuclease domain-containing protein [Aeromicrobium sp.]|nr:exonuclease domain-containing protein [Aeromicrobium sp.]